MYALADTHWKGQLLTALPWDFYPETTWRDDMMLGATELSIALAGSRAGELPRGLPVRSAASYLRDAAQWASDWIHGPTALSDTLNLYDVSALADYELDLAMHAQHASGLAVTSGQLLANPRGQITKGIGVARSDPFGFGFAWDQYDTITHGAGLTVMADEYDALTGQPIYATWAQHWLTHLPSMIMGNRGCYRETQRIRKRMPGPPIDHRMVRPAPRHLLPKDRQGPTLGVRSGPVELHRLDVHRPVRHCLTGPAAPAGRGLTGRPGPREHEDGVAYA